MSEPPRKAAILERLSAHLSLWGGWALLLLCFLITFEIIGRKLFSFSIQGADELGGYVFAFAATVGFTYGLYRRAHIRIDLLVPRLSATVQALLNVFAYLLLAIFAWLVIWRAWDVLSHTIEFNAVAGTPLATPLVIPQGLWFFALVIFGLGTAEKVVVALWLLVRGRLRDLAVEFGIVGIGSELTAELASAEARRAEDARGSRPDANP